MAAMVAPIVVVGAAMVPWWHTGRGGRTRGVVAMGETVAVTAVCGVCGEPAVKRDKPFPREGWALAVVDGERLLWQHAEGEPLCPEMTNDGLAPCLPVTKWVTTYTVTYGPWEDGADERERLSEQSETTPCGGDEYESAIDQAVEVLQYVIESSAYPWQPGSWYSEEGYEHPYNGTLEEKTHHLYGFTDDEQAEIWDRIRKA